MFCKERKTLWDGKQKNQKGGGNCGGGLHFLQPTIEQKGRGFFVDVLCFVLFVFAILCLCFFFFSFLDL